MATQSQVTLDTLITVKVALEGSNRRLKVPLRDLGANVFENKLRTLLSIPADQTIIFERFSDSAGQYVTLDPANTQVYKTLFRAAKAKLKLRLRATFPTAQVTESVPSPAAPPKVLEPTFLDGLPRLVLKDIPEQGVSIVSTESSKTSSEPKEDLSITKEAPVPRAFTAPGLQTQLAFRAKDTTVASPSCAWSVYCNQCDKPMSNDHFHCSICDDGDYDLCTACNEAGFHCRDQNHWLVKRFVKNGQVVNSTSERVTSRMPAPFPAESVITAEEKKPEVVEEELPTRTCNSCIKVLQESEFVTCKDCEDFDLCISCHVGAKHGHHPGHIFAPATPETKIGPLAEFLCSAGRNVRHNAICDGCDKYIYGVRHKCLNCPDWDYCSKCIKAAKFSHPAHRFVPIYDPLPEPRSMPVKHHGIFCDGPLCKDKQSGNYMQGVRYKCAVCHDTDFCATCEAAPSNRHNRTHPLIKFKTPVRNVSVTTMGEDRSGAALIPMGDHITRLQRRSASTETVPVPLANAATQVQTVVDLKPREEADIKKEKMEIKDLLAEPIQEKIQAQDLMSTSIPNVQEPKPSNELAAHFVRDTVTDGTKVLPGALFTQVWTLKNPGPLAWPAGCSVRYVGGDNMLNVNDNHPSSASEINEATESNVIQRPVEAGEEVSFRVLMKAPKRQGVAISYWRLKAADGTPFGHRLWCHVDSNRPANCTSGTSDLTSDTSRAYQQMIMLQAKTQQRAAVMAQQQMAGAALREQNLNVEANLKRHAEVRAQAIEGMRRAAERMNAELERVPRIAQEHATHEETKHIDEAKLSVDEKFVNDAKPLDKDLEKRGSMIFPQLEKESPVSSVHEAVTATQSQAHTERAESVEPMTPSVKSDLDFFEDAETIEYSDSSDDGFATDEEYEILDASDHELP